MKKDFYIFNNGELKRKDNTLFFESSDEKNTYLLMRSIIYGFLVK